MKHICTLLFAASLAVSSFTATVSAQTQASAQPRIEQLPTPVKTGGMPLQEAIAARKSSRDISPDSHISKQDISNMLWAAWGITHDDKRTVATALNKQELCLYAITATGICRYDAQANALVTVQTGDFRSLTGMQPFAKTAPLNIVFVADSQKQDKEIFQAYAAGAASQNIYLYCASAGLKTVLRASFDKDKLAKAMHLSAREQVLFVQTVGK